MIDRSARADMTEPNESTDPIENADSADPTDPIDNTDPTDPIDRIEPFEEMQRMEFSDLIDQRDCGADGMTPTLMAAVRVQE